MSASRLVGCRPRGRRPQGAAEQPCLAGKGLPATVVAVRRPRRSRRLPHRLPLPLLVRPFQEHNHPTQHSFAIRFPPPPCCCVRSCLLLAAEVPPCSSALLYPHPATHRPPPSPFSPPLSICDLLPAARCSICSVNARRCWCPQAPARPKPCKASWRDPAEAADRPAICRPRCLCLYCGNFS